MQLYRQLRRVNVNRLRQDEQAWAVRLKHEGAEDAGGPYRESIALLSGDLQSSRVSLFLPCPNTRDGNGENRDTWIPNPQATSEDELQQFKFLGMVMGLALFSKSSVELNLPPFVWKRLVGSDVTEADIEAFDTHFVKTTLKTLRGN